MPDARRPTYFKSPLAFRAWLEKNHRTADDLLVGFYKRGTGKPSLTWPESVDQALCFGWIDAVRRRVDDERYTIRFTPRRPNSIWSAVNLKRVAELTKQGQMHPDGLAAFERRSEERSRTYSYEQRQRAAFTADHLRRLRGNRRAWQFFQAQPPSYQRLITHWVTRAKAEATRLRRLAKLIEVSASGRRLA